ncbi:g2702 [Coccomyxa elongata]
MVSVTVISKGKKFTVKMDAADYNKKGTSGSAREGQGSCSSDVSDLVERHILEVMEDDDFYGRFQHLLYDSWRGQSWHVAARDIATFLLRAASPDVRDGLDGSRPVPYSDGRSEFPPYIEGKIPNSEPPDIPYRPDLDEYRTYYLKGPEWETALRMEDDSARTVVCNRIVREALSRIRSLHCVIADALREHQHVLDIVERPEGGVRTANEELQRRRSLAMRRALSTISAFWRLTGVEC